MTATRYRPACLSQCRSRACLVALAAACAVACGGDAERTESAAPLPQGTPVNIAPTPILEIGTAAGDTLHELHRVVTPFMLDDGRLVIPLGSALTLRVFDANGEYVTSLGRSGEGPGEFGYIGGAWARGDTIEVFDSFLDRITRFYPDGQFDVITLDRTVGVQGAVPGPVPDGWILHRIAGGSMASPDFVQGARDDIVIYHFALDGSSRGEIARTQGIARYTYPGGGGPTPLSPRAVLGVHDGLLYIGDTDSSALRVLRPDGSLHSEPGWQRTPPARTVAATIQAIIDSAVTASNVEEAVIRGRYESAPIPERLPVWWEFLVDAQGFIWVRPYDPVMHAVVLGGLGSSSYLNPGAGRGGIWTIVGPEGGIVNEIRLPSGFSPMQVLEDRVLGVRRDSLGVESVAVLPVERH